MRITQNVRLSVIFHQRQHVHRSLSQKHIHPFIIRGFTRNPEEVPKSEAFRTASRYGNEGICEFANRHIPTEERILKATQEILEIRPVTSAKKEALMSHNSEYAKRAGRRPALCLCRGDCYFISTSICLGFTASGLGNVILSIPSL